MNIKLGKTLALGRTAEIYAWKEGQVLKLFYDWFELKDIEFEQHMAQAVYGSGLPVPMAGEILQVNGRNGLVYQRVDGDNMFSVLTRQPWRVMSFARLTARLHAGMHAAKLRPVIPSQRTRLERKLRAAKSLSADQHQAILETLGSLPDGDALCHGDFHPGNILMTPRGAMVIDWIDASHGNPLADVARTTIIAIGAAATSQVPGRLEKALIRLYHSTYLCEYFRLRPGGKNEYRRWLPVVAAARLSENIPELETWLLAQAVRAGH